MKSKLCFLGLIRFFSFIAFVIFFNNATNAAGIRYVWVGGSSNLWNDSLNWNPSSNYPGNIANNDTVDIPNIGNSPVLNVPVTIDNILIEDGATLSNTSSLVQRLTVSHDVVIGQTSNNALLDFSQGENDIDLIIGGNLSGYGSVYLYGDVQKIEIGGDMTINGFISNVNSIGSTVIFNGSAGQTINPDINGAGSYTFDYFEDDNSSGVSLNASVFIVIQGDLSGTGLLNTGTTEVVLYGNMTLGANKFNVGNNAEILDLLGDNSNFNLYWIQIISNAQTFYKVDICDGDVLLGGNVVIKNNLNFDDDGDIVLQGHDLDLTTASITWIPYLHITYPNYNNGVFDLFGGYPYTTGLVVTDNASSGYLKMRTSTSGVLFPVGTKSNYSGSSFNSQPPSYTPISFTASSGNPALNVRVKPNVTGTNGSTHLPNVVNKTWVVKPDTAAQSFQIDPGWTDGDGTSYDETAGAVAHTAAIVAYRHSESTPWIDNIAATSTAQGVSAAPGAQDNLPGGSVYIGTDTSTFFYIAVGSVSALPVSLVSFTAQYRDGHVNLDWATASEQNNAYFEVQRAADAANWIPIGKVKGHGTTELYNSYADIDYLAGVAPTGTLYYRLKQVDFNGAFTYSDIRAVNLSNTAPGLSAYPNPVSNTLNVNWTASDENMVLRLVNMNGVNVYEQTLSGNGLMQKQIDMSALPAGIYYLRIISADGHTINQPVCKN